MKNGVSEIIGQALFGDGARGTAYRALRPLVCARCGGMVATGEMFTRARSDRQGLRLWPRCQACVPFTLDAGKPARSALLQSLLTPTKQEHASTEHHAEPEHAIDDERRKAVDERRKVEDERLRVEDERQRIDEAMRRRLGPALERARRSRSGNR
jgi:hypothetical protein